MTLTRTAFAGALATTTAALAPSPLLVEIESEQGHLSALSEKSKPEERASLVIPQKNLIHAVDAVLASPTVVDPVSSQTAASLVPSTQT